MGADGVGNVPAFGVCPPFRCWARVGTPPSAICGELAAWKRPGVTWLADAFYCDAHHDDGDVPIAGAHVVRRVHVEAHVYLTATATGAPMAQAEAVARLEAAIVAAGGVLDVEGIRSTVGRYPVPPVKSTPNASGDDPAAHPLRQ